MENNSFLSNVARNLLDRYGEKISQLSLVFPSRRAQLFFTEALSKLIDRPLWQPNYISFDEITKQYSPLKKADEFLLLTTLYKVYCKHTKSSETFDHFYFWGETLLKDFNDIDKYLVNVEMLFRNLSEQKKFDGDFSFLSDEQISYIQTFWGSFNPKNEGKLETEFIHIWNTLYVIYTEYREVLRSKGLAYSGMIYRDMTETIKTNPPKESRHYIFIGFNALGNCEQILFDHLKAQDRADFYWNYDDYYIENTSQEAGYFIRSNIKKFPSPSSFINYSRFKENKDIEIISAPSDVLQAKLLPDLLSQMKASYDHKTAVVLTDESLLIPVLHALPEEIKDINITLGYPLSQTPVFSLVELLLALQRSYKTFESQIGFYHKDVLAVLQHQYIKTVIGEEIDKLKEDILIGNKIYAEGSMFEHNSLLKLIFTPQEDYRMMIDYINSILNWIAYVPFDSDRETSALRKEYIFMLKKALNRLKRSLSTEGLEIGISVFISLIRDVFRNLRIPFQGEPIKGLQIMSLTETASLDFENVILLSANDDILPGKFVKPSYIPYNLRKAFLMPNNEQNESIIAYHFYRLVQGAKKIRLVYSSKSDETSTGEMSRYLYQLKYEAPLDVRENMATYQVTFGNINPIIIEKTPEIMEFLIRYLDPKQNAHLSPSSISTFIGCNLRFYFATIKKIKQQELVQEDVPVNIIGDIIHKIMEDLYFPLKGRFASRDTLKVILNNKANLDFIINKSFAQNFYNKDELPSNFAQNGKLLLIREVIRKYVLAILNYDLKNSDFTFLCGEERFKAKQAITFRGKPAFAKMWGIIDRIDIYQNNIRIIDYKTGGGKGKEKRLKFAGVESLFSVDPNIRNKEAFQTILYALFYNFKYPNSDKAIVPGLYFVRDSYLKTFDYHLFDSELQTKVEDARVYFPVFSELLSSHLSKLFNSDIPFDQTEYYDNCRTCPYKIICGR